MERPAGFVQDPDTGLFTNASFDVTLWAESPLVYNPTNIDVDHRGRLWVTEAVNYRGFQNDPKRYKHRPSGDRIVILDDRDEDGKADTSIVFVQDTSLRAPVGLAVIGNKAYVSCSPNLYCYTDTNFDDHADLKEIVLTGFGGYDHDHSLHAVYGGPDGLLYFNTGNAGPHIVADKSGWTLRSGSLYTGGSPYNNKNQGRLVSDDGKIWVGGLALRMQPDASGLEVLAHNFRNSYEVFPDSYGNLWQNDNDDEVVACRTSWVQEGGNAGYFSSDGTRSWQADQRPDQDLFAAHWHQDDPGVMPVGDRTGSGSPTGVLRYEGDLFGPAGRGQLLSADAGRNLIFAYSPQIWTSGYRLGNRDTWLSSLPADEPKYVWNDSMENARKEKSFRPSDLAAGTDGSIFVADWYDPVVGGHQAHDSTGYGRIYRVVPKGFHKRRPVIDYESTEACVNALRNPAIHVRFLGAQKLRSMGPSAIPSVSKLMDDPNPFVRARAIWLLAALGEAGRSKVLGLLEKGDTEDRVVALRALHRAGVNLESVATQLVQDSSAFIRREFMQGMRKKGYPQEEQYLLSLARSFTAGDRWYLNAIGEMMDSRSGKWYGLLKEGGVLGPDSRAWTPAMAEIAWRLHPREAIADLVARASDTGISRPERARMVNALGFVHDSLAVQAMMQLAGGGDKYVAELAAYWLGFRQSNEWFGLADWKTSGINPFMERRLALMKNKQNIVLDSNLSIDQRNWRLKEMARDSVGGQMLVALAAGGRLTEDIKPLVAEAIFKNPDASVRVQAARYLPRSGTDIRYNTEQILATRPDTALGRQVFRQSCATCHRLGAEGRRIGPDLNGISGKLDRVALLDAILHPDAGIVFGYDPWLLQTKEGTSHIGFVVSENKETLTLRSPTGETISLRVGDILQKKRLEKSLMPSAAELKLQEKELTDLIGWLISRQHSD